MTRSERKVAAIDDQGIANLVEDGRLSTTPPHHHGVHVSPMCPRGDTMRLGLIAPPRVISVKSHTLHAGRIRMSR
jgi:hypothetical protein